MVERWTRSCSGIMGKLATQWGGNFITSNCNLCPETTKLLSSIEGIHVAGFSINERRCKT